MSRTIRRLAIVALPATVLFAGIAVAPVSNASAKTLSHWATFQGEVDRGGRTGVAGNNPGTPKSMPAPAPTPPAASTTPSAAWASRVP